MTFSKFCLGTKLKPKNQVHHTSLLPMNMRGHAQYLEVSMPLTSVENLFGKKGCIAHRIKDQGSISVKDNNIIKTQIQAPFHFQTVTI